MVVNANNNSCTPWFSSFISTRRHMVNLSLHYILGMEPLPHNESPLKWYYVFLKGLTDLKGRAWEGSGRGRGWQDLLSTGSFHKCPQQSFLDQAKNSIQTSILTLGSSSAFPGVLTEARREVPSPHIWNAGIASVTMSACLAASRMYANLSHHYIVFFMYL